MAFHLVDQGDRRILERTGAFRVALRQMATDATCTPNQRMESLKAVADYLFDPSRTDMPDNAAGRVVAALADCQALLEESGQSCDSLALYSLGHQMTQSMQMMLTRPRFRDWSELANWCRFWAAPAGKLAALCAGLGDPALIRRAEQVAIVLQVLWLAEHAAEDFRQLDRLYLPQRWMAEAGIDEDAFAENEDRDRLLPLYRRVARQARDIMDAAGPLPRGLPGWRRRFAAAVWEEELRARIRYLALRGPGPGMKRRVTARILAGAFAGLLWQR